MSAPPPNPDTRDLPYGWVQQYNWEYRQWFYVNTHENPPRSCWEHPRGPMSQGFAAPPGPPPPDRDSSSSPYGGPPQPPPPAPGYGGGYQPSYGQRSPQGYYNNAPAGEYGGGYGAPPLNRGTYPEEQTVYVAEEAQQKKGPGWGGVAAAGVAGVAGGALLANAMQNRDERQGYQQGEDSDSD